ncbi:type II secretion system protein [Enterovibrio calviensis]|uniref:type II secretion system protein n=1 Tax=Enterovibrio calviensis TaxID=91359 RepID=UPI000483B5FA|nr:type II secretion system protein [Enterovibrio calviensis]
MKRQGGFTLIEMIVVIVILGILAVTAAPKFMNFQDDAKKASLQGLKGAIDSASGIVYAKAALEGKESGDTALADGLGILEGYPKADHSELSKVVIGLNDDWKNNTAAAANTLEYTLKNTSYDQCVVYTQASKVGNVVTPAATTITTCQ